MEPLPATPAQPRSLRGLELVALILVALALGWAYAPTFSYLINQVWAGDPNYSYGYFVIPIALAILWLRWPALDRAHLAPRWWGWVLLAGVFGLRSLFYQWNEQWFEDATLPLALISLALAFGGWALLRWSLPAIVFLCFMFPLPNRVNMFLAFPLQRLATIGSCDILQAMGLPVLAEGNVIIIGSDKLEVARACNGLSMLLSFLTLITAAAILIARPLGDRIVLLASAVPIALVANVLRITITALCYNSFGTDELQMPFGVKLPHDWAGYLMMPMALVLMWLELRVLSWLVVDDDDEAEPSPAFASASPGFAQGPASSRAEGGA